MPLSAYDALRQARTDIEAAKNARGSKTVIRHYQAAKKALDNVDDTEADLTSLREMITAFQDLALVVDLSRERVRAAKCRQRADALR